MKNHKKKNIYILGKKGIGKTTLLIDAYKKDTCKNNGCIVINIGNEVGLYENIR